MKKKSIILYVFLALLGVSGALNAGAFIEFINASSDGNNVTLEWKTSKEENVENFVLERKSVNGGFSYITSLEPKGNYSYYNYVDDSAYKTSSGQLYVYRLKIVDKDKSVTHIDVSVNHNVSSVKRTWGSIKAMFR